MDKLTQRAYEENAIGYSQDWLSQPEPTDIYSLITEFFIPGGTTADIGCGNGRDAKWMSENGFKVFGYDSSQELLNLATKVAPKVQFKRAVLPDLSEINQKFDNILCETVLMHLPSSQIPGAIKNLKRILEKNGVIYLSWRITEGEDQRHTDGRLYSAFEPNLVLNCFDKTRLLHFENKISESSGKKICRLVYRGD